MPDGVSPLDARRTVTARAAIRVPGDAAAVFAVVADVSRHPRWSPKALRIAGLPAGGPSQAGSSFTSYGVLPGEREHRNDVVVTRLEPPHLLELRSTDASGTYVNTFRVEQDDEQTVTLVRELTMPRPDGLLGATAPLFARLVLAKDLRRGLARLADLLRGRF